LGRAGVRERCLEIVDSLSAIELATATEPARPTTIVSDDMNRIPSD